MKNKWTYSNSWHQKFDTIAYVDESKAGNFVGDLWACALIWDYKQKRINGIDDSKKLTIKEREKLYPIIKERCLDYAIGIATLEEVNKLKVFKAAQLARERAVRNLKIKPQFIVSDAYKVRVEEIPSIGIVKADEKVAEVGMASIICKVESDKYIDKLHMEFPEYGWDHNRGYHCREHRTAIIKYGITKYHRKNMPVVKRCLEQRKQLIERGLFKDFLKVPYQEADNFLKKYGIWDEAKKRSNN